MFSLSKQLRLVSATGIALAAFCAPTWAADGAIRAIHYDQASRHFIIDTTGPVRAIVNTLTIAGHKRVIVDVDNADIGMELPRDAQLLQNLSQEMPSLRNVTVNQYGGSGGRPIVRILLDIDGDLKTIRMVHNQGPRLELEVNDSALAQTPYPPQSYLNPSQVQPQPQPQTPTPRDEQPQPRVTQQAPVSTQAMVPREVYERSIRAIEDQKRQIDALQRQVAGMQSAPQQDPAADELKRTLAALNQRYESLAQENQYLKARISTQSQSESDTRTISGMKAELDRLKTANANLQSQLNGLLTSNSASDNAHSEAVTDLQTKLAATQQKLNALARENNSLKAQAAVSAQGDPALSMQQDEINRLKKENQILQTRLQQAASKPTSEGTLAAKQAEIDKLQKTNGTLQAQLAALKARPVDNSGVKQAEIDRLQAANQELRNQLQQATVSATGAGVEDLKRTLVRMNQQYDTLKAENAQLKTQVGTSAGISDLDLQNMRKQLTTAQQSLSESIRTINEQNKEIAYLRNQVADVKAGMDAGSREQIAQLQQAADDKDTRIRQLEQQLAAKSSIAPTAASASEVAVLKRQLDQMTGQYKRSVDELNQQLKAKNQQLQERNQQLETARSQAGQVNSLQQQISSLQSQLTDAQAIAAKAAGSQISPAELQKRDSRIASLQNELTRTKADLDKARQTGTASQSNQVEISRLTQENQSLKASLETLKAQTGSTDQSRQLQERLAGLQSDLSELQTKYDKASQDAFTARQELEAARKANSGKPATTAAKGDSAALQKQLTDLRRENAGLKERLSAAAPSNSRPSSNAEAEQDYQAGKAAMTAGDLDKAIDRFKEAQLLDPDNGRFAIDYSIALAENHQYADSIELLRRYLQRNPGDRDAYNQLGKVYLLNDQADAASQAFSRAISVNMLNNYATSLKKQNKMDDAESIFKLALKLNPNDSEVLFNLGNLYNASNKLEQARNNYLQALQLKPDFAEAHYNLGLIYSKLGDRTQAVNHLEKFLQLSPNARNADTIRAYVEKLKA